MAQHGYLHDQYDRDFTGDDRERDERWRDRDDDRSLMFDRDARERSWRTRDDDRSRSRDEGRSWFRDDNDEGRWDHGRFASAGRSDVDEWFGGRSSRESSRRNFSSHPDDHYRSWRDKQMQALDRDYADYCREREQQFHQDFDSWRTNRQQSVGLRGQWGAEQGRGPDEQTFTPQTTAVGNTMTTSETHEPQSTTEPDGDATLGTTSRGKR